MAQAQFLRARGLKQSFVPIFAVVFGTRLLFFLPLCKNYMQNIPLLHFSFEGKMSIREAVQKNDAIKLQEIITTSTTAEIQILEKSGKVSLIYKPMSLNQQVFVLFANLFSIYLSLFAVLTRQYLLRQSLQRQYLINAMFNKAIFIYTQIIIN